MTPVPRPLPTLAGTHTMLPWALGSHSQPCRHDVHAIRTERQMLGRAGDCRPFHAATVHVHAAVSNQVVDRGRCGANDHRRRRRITHLTQNPLRRPAKLCTIKLDQIQVGCVLEEETRHLRWRTPVREMHEAICLVEGGLNGASRLKGFNLSLDGEFEEALWDGLGERFRASADARRQAHERWRRCVFVDGRV